MTIEERNADILRLLDEKKREKENATLEEKRAAALKLLAATGMYNDSGRLKPEFSPQQEAR